MDRTVKKFWSHIAPLLERLLFVVLGAVLAVLVPEWLSSDPEPPPATQHMIFTPQTGNETNIVHMTARSGSCYDFSYRNPSAPGTHACIDSNQTRHDPCYETRSGIGALLCFPHPWELFRLWGISDPPRRLKTPNPQRLPATSPWALELENGVRCLYTPFSDQEVPPGPVGSTYFCASQLKNLNSESAEGWIYGGIRDTDEKTWNVDYRSSDAYFTKRVAVRVTWR